MHLHQPHLITPSLASVTGINTAAAARIDADCSSGIRLGNPYVAQDWGWDEPAGERTARFAAVTGPVVDQAMHLLAGSRGQS